jgi:hypothetical protein
MGVAKYLSKGDFGSESHLASQLLPTVHIFTVFYRPARHRKPSAYFGGDPLCEAKPKNVGEKSASEPLLSKTRTGL